MRRRTNQHFRWSDLDESVLWSVLKCLKVKGKLSRVLCGKEEEKILLIVENIIVCKSCVIKAVVIETRRDSNVEGIKRHMQLLALKWA